MCDTSQNRQWTKLPGSWQALGCFQDECHWQGWGRRECWESNWSRVFHNNLNVTNDDHSFLMFLCDEAWFQNADFITHLPTFSYLFIPVMWDFSYFSTEKHGAEMRVPPVIIHVFWISWKIKHPANLGSPNGYGNLHIMIDQLVHNSNHCWVHMGSW